MRIAELCQANYILAQCKKLKCCNNEVVKVNTAARASKLNRTRGFVQPDNDAWISPVTIGSSGVIVKVHFDVVPIDHRLVSRMSTLV